MNDIQNIPKLVLLPTIVAYAEIKVGYSLRDSKQILQFYYCNARFGLKTHHSWGDKFIPLPVEVVVSQRVIGFQRISRPVRVKLCVCHWVSFIFSAEIEDDSSGFFFIYLNHCLHLAVRRELCVCALKSFYVWFYSMIFVILKGKWKRNMQSVFEIEIQYNTRTRQISFAKNIGEFAYGVFRSSWGEKRTQKNKKKKERERRKRTLHTLDALKILAFLLERIWHLRLIFRIAGCTCCKLEDHTHTYTLSN